MELTVIEEQLIGGGGATRAVVRAEMLRVLRRIRERLETLDNRLTATEQLVPVADARFDSIEAGLAAGRTRLTALEDTATATATQLDALEATAATVLTVTVVANLGALPATANVRRWYRVAGDPAVYIGNGAGQPLTKLVPDPI